MCKKKTVTAKGGNSTNWFHHLEQKHPVECKERQKSHKRSSTAIVSSKPIFFSILLYHQGQLYPRNTVKYHYFRPCCPPLCGCSKTLNGITLKWPWSNNCSIFKVCVAAWLNLVGTHRVSESLVLTIGEVGQVGYTLLHFVYHFLCLCTVW